MQTKTNEFQLYFQFIIFPYWKEEGRKNSKDFFCFCCSLQFLFWDHCRPSCSCSWGGAGRLMTAWQEWKSRLRTGLCWHGMGFPVFSVIADWSTVVIVQKFSVLPGCPFLILWLERAEFSVVLSMPVGISGLPASSAPSVECRREKEKPGAHHQVIPWISRSLTGLSSLHTSMSS